MRAKEVTAALNGQLFGEDLFIEGVASLKDASVNDMSLIMWPQDIRWAKTSRAGVVLLSMDYAADYADVINASLIVVEDLGASIFALKRFFDDGAGRFPRAHFREASIDSTALIHPSAQIGNVVIGAKTVIGPHVVIEDGTMMGSNCVISAGVIIHQNTLIDDKVSIGANSVIGSMGFVPYGSHHAQCLPCFGYVHIAEGVRMGSLSTVDRGFLGPTRVGKNSLIDNMVHLGHDVVIDENVIIAGQSGLAGFVAVQNHVTLGGQVGIKPHVVVEEGARVSGKSLVHCDVKKYEIWSGNPSVPHALYLRAFGQLKRSFKDKKR